jgi:hypothetical protein
MSYGEILKNKGDFAKFQKYATILKFLSGNQPEEDNTVISKTDAKKCIILQLSEDNSHKLLLSASALENVDTSKKCQTANFKSAFSTVIKQLKLEEFKDDSNPACIAGFSIHFTISW